MFAVYDVDSDGFISVDDLTSVLTSLVGNNLTEAEVATLAKNTVTLYDNDGDDMLSFEEFTAVRRVCVCPRLVNRTGRLTYCRGVLFGSAWKLGLTQPLASTSYASK